MVAWNKDPEAVVAARQPNPLAIRRTILRRGASDLWKRRDAVIEQGIVAHDLDYALIEEMAKAADIVEGVALETAAVVIDRAEPVEQQTAELDEPEFVPFWCGVQ